jgi:hypothetical protein
MVNLRAARPPETADSEEAISLRLGVHDSSRLEWTVGAPLPGKGERDYEVEFSVEVPAHLYAPHDVWDQKQTWTRLQSPSESGELQVDRDDIDELRRDTLGVAHRLKTLRGSFERSCLAAALSSVAHRTLEDELTEPLVQAVDFVDEMRRLLAQPFTGLMRQSLPALREEWRLSDEFLSHALLDFLGAAQRAIDQTLMGPKSKLRETPVDWLDELRCLVAEALAEELAHRRGRGWINPRPDAPTELARFLERGSRLKKHFQDVLYLDVEAYMVDHRLRNWTGIVAASLAAAFWMGFTLLPIGPGAKAGISAGAFAVIFAASYALKDRIKELTRQWLAGRLTRLYGQRHVTLRLPARIDPAHRVLMKVRERFDLSHHTDDDSLNRHVGRTQRMQSLTFHMRCEAQAQPLLQKAGIRSVKHVFRYDLSPMLPRLDDAVKQVPVLDPKSRRVCFVEAPKEYRLPLRLTARANGLKVAEELGVLIVSKRGIERLEPVDDE